MPQKIIFEKGCCAKLGELCKAYGMKKYMLVHDGAFPHLGLAAYFTKAGLPFVSFDGFTPNPNYEDVLHGLALFQKEKCDGIVAVGGGSAIDTAKCIKLFGRKNPEENPLAQLCEDTKIPLFAVPTTAGTGSESTRFAVIYEKGEKQNVAHESILPDVALLDYALLRTLPLHQKKCTMLDAFCQGIEACWSVHSTAESLVLSHQAVRQIAGHWKRYIFQEDELSLEMMMGASNLAGQAIYTTKTTAAHAMSYKITSLYGLPHGYAVALCLPKIWRYMLDHLEKCIDPRGAAYVAKVWQELAEDLGVADARAAVAWFEEMMAELELSAPEEKDALKIEQLVSSVNLQRLQNNPIALSEEALEDLYRQILRAAAEGEAHET